MMRGAKISIEIWWNVNRWSQNGNILPSGKQTVCYWKWPFIVDLPITNGIFHSLLYVYGRVVGFAVDMVNTTDHPLRLKNCLSWEKSLRRCWRHFCVGKKQSLWVILTYFNHLIYIYIWYVSIDIVLDCWLTVAVGQCDLLLRSQGVHTSILYLHCSSESWKWDHFYIC